MRTSYRLLAAALALSACSFVLLNAAVTLDELKDLSHQVREGKAFGEAIKTAQEAFTSKTPLLQGQVLILYTNLVHRGKAINEAKEAASKSIETGKLGGSLTASMLFKALFEKEEWTEEARELAKKFIQSEDLAQRMAALNLYLALVEKEKAFDEATKAAQDSINPKNITDEKRTGLLIFTTLINKGHGRDEIATALQNALITEKDEQIRQKELSLLKKIEDLKKVEDAKKKETPPTATAAPATK